MFLIFDSAIFLLSQGVVPISWQAVLSVVLEELGSCLWIQREKREEQIKTSQSKADSITKTNFHLFKEENMGFRYIPQIM